MKSKLYLYIIFFSCICMCSSCITRRDTAYLQQGGPIYHAVLQEEYRLRINDEVSYFLITSNEATQVLYNGTDISFRIFNDGTIHLPIGQVKIVGLTLREAENVLRNAFSNIVLDAEIRLTLINNFFFVQGDGKKGQFQIYKENLNIFQALAMAGDISIIGDKKNIKLIRRGADGLDHTRTIDLRQESIIESEFYYIMPNDVIVIPTTSKAFFHVESLGSFFSMVVTPISFLLMVLTLFK